MVYEGEDTAAGLKVALKVRPGWRGSPYLKVAATGAITPNTPNIGNSTPDFGK